MVDSEQGVLRNRTLDAKYERIPNLDLVWRLAPDPQDASGAVVGFTIYVATDKLRSLIDYRLLASSRNDNWRIVSLVAGD